MNCWAGLGGALDWTDWKYDSQFSSKTKGACFSFMVSSIDSRHFQNFVISVFSAKSSNWRILALYYSFFLEWSNVLYCVRTAWYSSRKMRSKGSLCFWFDNFLNLCLSKRYSPSNHFLFEDDLKRFCFKSI